MPEYKKNSKLKKKRGIVEKRGWVEISHEKPDCVKYNH